MQRISITNPQNVIDGTAKKYYFKLRNTGGPKGDKGDKGDTGATGPQGPQGNAATVSVGSTTTLPVGYDATVTNSGSIYNAVLDFGIPQGPRGPQGAKGEKGDTGAQGETGPRGPQGERGTNATVSIGTTYTLNPGSQATVYNSGSDSNAVLNFGIPKGEKGDTGPMPTIAQTTGQAIDQVMSQKATTDALNTKQATISSSNKLSADLVTDTTTTNKFVTASEKATWNAKQNALTAGQGIDITSDVISTPALVPEVVASLPAEGTEGKLYLTPKAHTTQTATGNPITATITDGAGKIESLKLDGDTYQQTYTGKNLIDGIFRQGNKQDFTTTNRIFTTQNLPVESGATYTISTTLDTSIYKYAINIATAPFPQPTENVPYDSGWLTSDTFSFTPSINGYLGIIVAHSNGTTNLTPSDISGVKWQLEKSSSASSYEPYVGGVPSPNPSYPQQIQTVTGEQTVSINGTDYPISLGTIELCKLGTYQDYIYKDGDDWKVHKATELWPITGNSSAKGYIWEYPRRRIYLNPNAGDGLVFSAKVAAVADNNTVFPACANKFVAKTFNNIITDGINGFCLSQSKAMSFRNNAWPDETTARSQLDGANVIYPLATPTDTAITDTNLIAQLEAIRTASLENGTNTITNTATGTNLAGDMEIGYYGYNPTNRYDKWLWLDLNNNYEKLGS